MCVFVGRWGREEERGGRRREEKRGERRNGRNGKRKEEEKCEGEQEVFVEHSKSRKCRTWKCITFKCDGELIMG